MIQPAEATWGKNREKGTGLQGCAGRDPRGPQYRTALERKRSTALGSRERAIPRAPRAVLRADDREVHEHRQEPDADGGADAAHRTHRGQTAGGKRRVPIMWRTSSTTPIRNSTHAICVATAAIPERP